MAIRVCQDPILLFAAKKGERAKKIGHWSVVDFA